MPVLTNGLASTMPELLVQQIVDWMDTHGTKRLTINRDESRLSIECATFERRIAKKSLDD